MGKSVPHATPRTPLERAQDLAYDAVEDAEAHINALPKPLALYWFDEDGERTTWALHNLQAGGVCVNETLMHIAQEELPFGGIGPSGMGHYHGRHGFETFSKMTPVFVQSKLNGMGLFMPPYGAAVQRMLELQRGTVLLTLTSAQGGLFDEVPPPQAS